MKFEFVIADENCPRCNREGSPKVADEEGRWWWKCYSEGCSVGYWLPETGEIEERLSEEQAQEVYARVQQQVQENLADKVWITQATRYGGVSRAWPKDKPVPDGWHLEGSEAEDAGR